jgi:hypothetical protein
MERKPDQDSKSWTAAGFILIDPESEPLVIPQWSHHSRRSQALRLYVIAGVAAGELLILLGKVQSSTGS